MHCSRDIKTKQLFQYIKRKHSLLKIDVTQEVEGELRIKSIRKYTGPYGERHEVDVEFTGYLWGRCRYAVSKKYSYADLPNLSKVKAYRILRKKVWPILRSKLAMFDINVRCENISKIKWVG